MSVRSRFGDTLGLVRTTALGGLLTFGGAAFAGDPVLAPGRDPAGTAVAVLADGFDYTRSDLARVLARDGEGEAVAWDAVDGDHRPFASDGSGTEIALAVAAQGGARIVPVRIAQGDPVSLAKGVAFVAGTPARTALVGLAPEAKDETDVLLAAAERFPAVLFVGAVPRFEDGVRKRGEALPNLILFEGPGLAAAEAMARALGCGRGDLIGADGAELKRALLGHLAGASSPGCAPERDTKTK